MDSDATQRTPFAAFIQQQRKGGLHGELTDAFGELIQAVAETGKVGSLSLSIKVTPNKDGATVTVNDKIKLTIPEPEKGASMFFYDQHGNLTRNNPAQPELPLRDAAELKAETA
jgi:hypothetical protein